MLMGCTTIRITLALTGIQFIELTDCPSIVFLSESFVADEFLINALKFTAVSKSSMIDHSVSGSRLTNSLDTITSATEFVRFQYDV